MSTKLSRRVIVVMVLTMLLMPVVASSQAKEVVLKWPCIWVGKDSKAPAITEIVNAFNAANAGKIKVEIEPQPDYNAYEQKVRTSIAAGQAPGNIFSLKLNATTQEFYNSKLLFDFAGEFTGAWKKSFDKGAVAQSTINGKLKTLPFETAILPLWYNMDLLKKAGVTSVPTTPAEFWAAMDKVKAAGIFPTSQMSGDTNAWTSMIWFSHFAVSFGGADVWSKPFTDPAFVEAAKLIKRMFESYTTPDAVGAGAGVSGGHFLAGRTAVFSNGPWYAGRADLRATPFFNSIVIANPPSMGPKKGISISRLQANIAASETKDKALKAAIVSFLKFLTSKDNIQKLAATSGAMFAVDSGYVPTDAFQKQFYDLVASSKVTATDLEAALGAEATLEFAQQLGALALGKVTAEEFCALVEKKIDR
jgi:raffinose/stachyose/melibiose transport system substrate-binding protein